MPSRSPILRSTIALSMLLVLGGCTNIRESLKLEKTILVKVPISEPVAKQAANGWEFRHVVQAPTDERRGQWYVAWNKEHPLTTSRISAYWKTLFSRADEIAVATHRAFGQYPTLIEPNRTFIRPAPKDSSTAKMGDATALRRKGETPAEVVINAMPLTVWPDGRKPGQDGFSIDPMWYFDDQHSQLKTARARFAKPGDGITIGHLDNGLDGRHVAAPLRLARGDWKANAVGLLAWAQNTDPHKAQPKAPEEEGGTHGLGTIGILAGGHVKIAERKVRGGRIEGYTGWLGGAPYATVVPMRVAPWVFSFSTGELAYAIDYASRVKGCDVLTMSHGGAPTQAWVDAVNAAYERGTAMFAAESDFFSILPRPIKPKGIFLPSSPVYPAAFRRVVGVTGATANDQSYATNSLWQLLRNPLKIKTWMSRGSFGADLTSTVLYRPNREPDRTQTWRQGELRPHPIAGYSPNIPWLSTREKDGRKLADGVDLDGSGTSASTPQVAAAAALWLQKNRSQFTAAEWHGWQKAEAAYQALLGTAERHGRTGGHPYLGAGVLRADKALQVTFSELKTRSRPKGICSKSYIPPGTLWFERSGNDYFDGARSFRGILGLQTLKQVAPEDRAKLVHQPPQREAQQDAMQRLYYNMMLLERWHKGKIPLKDERDKTGHITRAHDEGKIWNRAGDLAKKTEIARAKKR